MPIDPESAGVADRTDKISLEMSISVDQLPDAGRAQSQRPRVRTGGIQILRLHPSWGSAHPCDLRRPDADLARGVAAVPLTDNRRSRFYL